MVTNYSSSQMLWQPIIRLTSLKSVLLQHTASKVHRVSISILDDMIKAKPSFAPGNGSKIPKKRNIKHVLPALLTDDQCKAAACFFSCPRVAFPFPPWAEASCGADEELASLGASELSVYWEYRNFFALPTCTHDSLTILLPVIHFSKIFM